MKTLALNQLFQWLIDIQAEGKASLARGYDPVCLFTILIQSNSMQML